MLWPAAQVRPFLLHLLTGYRAIIFGEIILRPPRIIGGPKLPLLNYAQRVLPGLILFFG